MHSIVVATADDDLRLRIVEQLAADGSAATWCANWADTLARTAQDGVRLVLVDGELPGASGALLEAVARSVPHAPDVRVIRGELLPLASVRSPAQLRRLTTQSVRPLFSARERRLADLVGIGSEPLLLLQQLARGPLPVRFQGERGTGKEWVARIVHRMAGDAERPFVVVHPEDPPVVRDSAPGTLYLESLDAYATETVLDTLALAQSTGWRVMAGSRHGPSPRREGMGWTHVHLRPLRERPKDIRPLTRLYLEDYRTRLGLPSRRVHPRLWELIERHPWPGNHRELETFVVQLATSARGATLSPESVPRRVIGLLDPGEQDRGERRAFEDLVESRLQPVVARHEPAPGAPSLYEIVIDATERALLRAVLVRTGGNQKAAALLLGIARNTLRERVSRLDPMGEQGHSGRNIEEDGP
jgi:DNA-binding NtrC family response regulator